MDFDGICVITEDVPRLSRFYQHVLQTEAEGDHVHVLLKIGGTALAIYSKTDAERDMGFDFSKHWGSGNFTVDFCVDNVDAEYIRLQLLGVEFVTSPKTYPWGSRSVHFRDPDGNIVTFRSQA